MATVTPVQKVKVTHSSLSLSWFLSLSLSMSPPLSLYLRLSLSVFVSASGSVSVSVFASVSVSAFVFVFFRVSKPVSGFVFSAWPCLGGGAVGCRKVFVGLSIWWPSRASLRARPRCLWLLCAARRGRARALARAPLQPWRSTRLGCAQSVLWCNGQHSGL